MRAFVSRDLLAKRFFVSGVVQGVGFRYFTRDEATRLGLAGFARNLWDGRVEVYAIGSAGQIEQLHDAIRRGPPGARVSEVTEEPAPIDTNYEGRFSITYDQ